GCGGARRSRACPGRADRPPPRGPGCCPCPPRASAPRAAPATARPGVGRRRGRARSTPREPRRRTGTTRPGRATTRAAGRPSIGPADRPGAAAAALGPVRADRDQLDALVARLDRADDLRADPHDVPPAQLAHLVVELDPARAADDDVRLLLLAVVVPRRRLP